MACSAALTSRVARQWAGEVVGVEIARFQGSLQETADAPGDAASERVVVEVPGERDAKMREL